MAEKLKEIALEHSGGVDEEPMRRFDNVKILLMVEVPYLWHYCFLRIYYFTDFSTERANGKTIGKPIS